MNKLNKKGFTLIEMLVVIAIIAVLVSIIIPTVTSATDKAAAATNAANLRSLVAEATTKYLTSDTSSTGNVTVDVSGPTVTTNTSAPTSKKVGSCAAGQTATLTWDAAAGAFVASYGGYTLDQFAQVASGEITPAQLTASAVNPNGGLTCGVVTTEDNPETEADETVKCAQTYGKCTVHNCQVMVDGKICGAAATNGKCTEHAGQ